MKIKVLSIKLTSALLNRFGAIIIGITLLPIIVFISLLIIYFDGFPVLFKQKRIGVNNSFFYIYKFRTMKNNLPDIPTHQVKNPESLYIKSGPMVRKLSLDELPQLLNIIKGDMVFVGPRPALYNQDDLIEFRTKVGVHELLPGVTGWAQVNGRDELSIPVKVKYDEEYLLKKSTIFDLKIIFLTLIRVLGMKGVSH